MKRVYFFATVAAAALIPAGCSDEASAPDSVKEQPSATNGQALDAKQVKSLGIRTVEAQVAGNLPLGTVPALVTLPPEARVAVTSAFPGAMIRLYVIEGQEVRRGQVLGLVRSTDSIQFRGDLSRARSEVSLAQARSARLDQLAKEGIIAQARAEEGRAALQQAQATLSESRRLTSMAGAGSDGTMSLSAPISGRVAHIGVDTGGPVDGMTAPFVIENASAYRLDLQIPERIAQDVRPGMALEIAVAATDGKGEPVVIGGKILSINPSIDPATRSIMAKASIGAAPGLVSGQNVMATILGSSASTGVSIPTSAITKINGASHVFIRKNDRFIRRKIVVGGEAGSQSIIAEGITPGEVVAVSGVAELKAMTAE